jgi:hypothetical protein
MALKADVSLPLALATGTFVYSIYSRMPNNADIRAAGIGEQNVDKVRKQNAVVAAGAVAGISLLAKDPTIFIVGGATLVAIDWIVRINNFTNPVTQRIEDVYEATRLTSVPAATPNEAPPVSQVAYV